MQKVTLSELSELLGRLAPNPRIVASGNFATPRALLAIAESSLPEFRLHMVNAQPGIPDRVGITYESAFVGALHSHGGKSIMALQSWHPKAKTSTIVPRLTEYVTSFQHSHVITEQGVADCFGHTEHEQATNLIERAAHPDARAELRVAATNLGLI